MKRSLGFTLIELLLSVSIIAILSARARDSQRLSDLRKVQGALEMYFADHRSYPVSNGWEELTSIQDDMTGYLSTLPSGVRDGEAYMYNSDGSSYQLLAEMETENSANGNCFDYGGFTPSLCYGVTNP